jgi:hypothetical protein
VELQETLAARKSRYGDFTDHARVTQALKDICRNAPSWGQMTPVQREGLEMIMHKVGRMLCGDPNYADTPHDIAGYARLIEERCKESADA